MEVKDSAVLQGKMSSTDVGGERKPVAGALMYPLISCRAFLTQSGAGEEEQGL